MPAPRKYPNELRERSQRLVAEARQQEPDLSLTAAVKRIGPRVGSKPDTLRGWCKARPCRRLLSSVNIRPARFRLLAVSEYDGELEQAVETA